MKQQFAVVPIGRFRDAVNVRRSLGGIEELAASVRVFGVLEPVVGCMTKDGQGVELLMGQRRLAACRLAGLEEVPCLIRPRPSARDRLLMQLAENLDRHDMSPIDEGRAFAKLREEGLSQVDIAKAVRRSQPYVSDRLIALRLPECLQEALHQSQVRLSAALALPRVLFDDTDAVERLAGAVHDGDRGVAKWAEAEATRIYSETGETIGGARAMFKPFNVRLEVYQRAAAAARAEGVRVGVWIERLVLQETGPMLEAVEDHG